MRRRTLEVAVGLGLLLGPLAYALTYEPCEPQPTTTVRFVEVERLEPEAGPAPTPACAPAAAATCEPPPAPRAPTPRRLSFAFVNEAGIVLSTEAQPGWGKGRLRGHAGPGAFRAAKHADGTAVPESLWAHRGRTFDLYNAAGKVCTARLGALWVVAQHDGPSLYDVFYDDDSDVSYDDFAAKEHSAQKIRKTVWSRAEDTMWLTAEVLSDESCTGAVWARDHELPTPTLLHRSELPDEVSIRRIAQHESSEVLRDTKSAYANWDDGSGEEPVDSSEDWNAMVARSPAKARTWLDAQGMPRLVELDFGDGDGECGSPGTRIEALDWVLEQAFEPTGNRPRPLAVFDADLDGKLEMLYDSDGTAAQSLDSATLGWSWGLNQAWVCPC